MSFTKFLKNIWAMLEGLLYFLVSVALFPPYAIILENKSEALGRKSIILRMHLAIRKSSENIDPWKNMDGMLLEKWGI